ncbi:MAG: hypothetical protein HOV79_08085 [Hamadaea sp.]|nr:hypothetical protein [Hamadaea sp.]
MNEDDLRAAFARHEAEAPDVRELADNINIEVRRRRARRTRALTGAVAVVAALAIAVPVWLAQRGGVTPPNPVDVAASLTEGPQKDLNLLLLGSDHRSAWPENVARADTIVIVHIPADRKKIYTISIDRNTVVDIPAYVPAGYAGGREKINSAYYFGSQKGGGPRGGLALTEQVITKLSGVTFDGGAVVEMSAVKTITDALGGVPVCLPVAVKLYLDPVNGTAPPGARVLPAGCQSLNGSDALALIRQRYGLPHGSYSRDRNVQRYLVGAVQKISELNLFTDADKIAALVATKGVTPDLGTLSAPQLALQLRDFTAGDLVPLSQSTTFNAGPSGGEAFTSEGLTLLKALANGTIAQFAVDHPQLVLQR